MMDLLPESCQVEIYTKFLFKNYLYKFRRFFNIRNTRLDYPLNKRGKLNQHNYLKIRGLKYKRVEFKDGTIGL